MPARTNSPLAVAVLVLATVLASRISPGQLAAGRAGAPVQSQAGICKMSGVVKNRLTGQPIERALVDGQVDAALTDSEGRFELHLLCGGYSQLQVQRPGYANLRGADTLSVRVEPDAPEVAINLTPRATITGHVSVSNGGDPGDLEFQAYEAGYWHGHLRWNLAGRAKTDSNGVFRIYDLDSPAQYLLCSQQAQERLGIPSTGKATYGYPSTCYPSAMSDTDGLLRLTPGQQAEVELPITRQPFYRVTISRNSPEGQPQGLSFFNHNGAVLSPSFRWIDEDQSWEVWLPNGTYYAESRSWGPSPRYGRTDIKIANTSVTGLRMVVLPLAPVEVVIHKLFTAQTNQQPVDEANPGLGLELIPVESKLEGFRGGIALSHSEDDEPGHFTAQGVTPGRYWVQAFYFADGYVSALSSGSTDLMREPLVIGAGNSVAPIEVTVRNDGGAIDCNVNNFPTKGVWYGTGVISGFMPDAPVVFAIPAGVRLSRLQYRPLNETGTARIENLAPGLYHIVALTRFRDLDSADPTELANLIAQGKDVRVEAATSASVRIDFAKEDAEPNP